MRKLLEVIPGFGLAAAVALSASYINQVIGNLIPSMTISILLGIFLGNLWKIPGSLKGGILFSLRSLLRIAIILLGFRITFQEIVEIGMLAFIVDLLVVIFTFLFAMWLSIKVFKIDQELAYLIAVGSSICGASAILATAPIINSKNHNNTIAVAVVTVFGSLSMFSYPLLFQLGMLPGLDEISLGVFVGASIHEIGQVISAGFAVSELTGNTAVIVKLARVMLLAPVLLILSWFLSKNSKVTDTQSQKIQFPWFVLFFILMSGIHSIHVLPTSIEISLGKVGMILMLISMAALGLETNFRKVILVGIKPLYVGLLLTLFLFVFGLALTLLFFA